MRERLIEQKLRNGVRIKGGLALKFISPGTAGVPDRIVLLPDGKVFFVELKAPGKYMSPKQIKMAGVFARLGHQVRVINSMEDVQEFLDEISAQ